MSPTSTQAGRRDAQDLLDDVLRADGITTVFQPVVDLDSGAVVGYEALARGPRSSGLESPDQLFSAARAASRVVDLDRACRLAAVACAREARLVAPLGLFVNVEPESLLDPVGLDAWEPSPDLRCFVEVTERALASRPAEVLQALGILRERGFGVALGDLGAGSDSLTLMPFCDPDVIKLDLRLLGAPSDPEFVQVVHAAAAQADRRGAVILVEGIETEKQRMQALVMGARLGQGRLLGAPAPTSAGSLAPPPRLAVAPGLNLLGSRPAEDDGRTPFELGAAERSVRTSTKRVVLGIARQLEEQATALSLPPVVLSTFEEVALFTPVTRKRYSRLAEHYAFVGALGAGMEDEPAPGVRGGHLTEDDPVRWEWDLVVVGAHFAAALVARDLGDASADLERRFDYALVFERDLVVRMGRALMERVSPA